VRKDFADDQDPCEQENYLLVTDGLRFIVVERRNGMFTAFAVALVAAPYLMMQGLRRYDAGFAALVREAGSYTQSDAQHLLSGMASDWRDLLEHVR